jgi:hypothetical protein
MQQVNAIDVAQVYHGAGVADTEDAGSPKSSEQEIQGALLSNAESGLVANRITVQSIGAMIKLMLAEAGCNTLNAPAKAPVRATVDDRALLLFGGEETLRAGGEGTTVCHSHVSR